MTSFYQKDELIDNLWSEFTKTSEYKSTTDPFIAIPQDHQIIIRREEEGLKMVVQKIQSELANRKYVYLDQLKNRHPSDWQQEWVYMHGLLFKRVLKKRGCLRDGNVWFDTLEATEQLYKIPPAGLVGVRLAELADEVQYLFTKEYESLEKKTCTHGKNSFPIYLCPSLF